MRALLAVEFSAFGFFGLLGGCYAVLLVDLVRALEISPGVLGVVLFLGSAASIATTVGLVVWLGSPLTYERAVPARQGAGEPRADAVVRPTRRKVSGVCEEERALGRRI